MKILFISRCLPSPPISGDRVILHNLARELAARGHTLELLAFGNGAQEPGDTTPFAYGEAIPERSRSARDYVRRAARLFPQAAHACWNPAMWHAIHVRVHARRPDLVHFFGGVQVYEFRNQIAPALPNIIVPYESFSLYLARKSAQAASAIDRLRLLALQAAARWYESRIFEGFGRVVLVTRADESHLRRLAPGLPTAVIPNGVDSDTYRPTRGRSRGASLVFVGNLSFQPNIDAARSLIRDILPRVKAELPQARLVIVGTQPPPDLLALAGEDVQVTGEVPDIRPHLDQAACFVSPLTSGTGMRNKILEAMAMGVAVVATPLSCEGLEVRQGENVLLGRNPQELAAAVVRFLRDESLRQDIGDAGRRLVRERYTWGKVADQYEMLYDAVIAEHARRAVEAAR